jgi:hypothetical protein
MPSPTESEPPASAAASRAERRPTVNTNPAFADEMATIHANLLDQQAAWHGAGET